jgi:hypothetical protein
MPDPNKPARPVPAADPAAPAADPAVDDAAETADEAVTEVPLNRAARRGRPSDPQKPPPGHVGPQAARSRSGQTPRSHTKRRSV